jgi:hypothetical protein
MKKKLTLILVVLININYFCFAQGAEEGYKQKAEAVYNAYITKELTLTKEESEKFWPVYNDYRTEIKSTIKGNGSDPIELEEKVLNTRKKYKNDFKKVLGSDERVNKLFVAEKTFERILRNELQDRKKKS